MEQIQKIIQEINTIDTFHEFSDNPIKWELENNRVNKVKQALKEYPSVNIKNMLNNIGKVNFDRYFKNGYS